MKLTILHIDDEKDVRDTVQAVINGREIGGFELFVKDSCGFEEGMTKLDEGEYDLVILDLCKDQATADSDKVGQAIFEEIKMKAFIPIVFFTGLPGYLKDTDSDIVKVVGKSDGYEALYAAIALILDTESIQVKHELEGLLKKGLRDFYWGFMHPNGDLIKSLKQNDESHKYVLLRRLGRFVASEIIRNTDTNPSYDIDKAHPLDFYIYPPIGGNYNMGDIVKSKQTGKYSILLTPSCDMVLRVGGKRNAGKVLLANMNDFLNHETCKKLIDLKGKQTELQLKGADLSEVELKSLKNLMGQVKELMRPNYKERYFFLPNTVFLPASLIDFEDKMTIAFEELEKEYEVITSVDDPVAQAISSAYARYISRIGYKDLDLDFVAGSLFS